MQDLVIPYFVPAGVEGEKKSGVVVLPQTVEDTCEAELVVLSGGPVFLLTGSLNAEEAFAATMSVNPMFELGAAVGMVANALLSGNLGQVTIASLAKSVGYLHLKPIPGTKLSY